MRTALLILLALGGVAHAEKWAARVYTTVDGLSNDRVDRGARDPAGYLWFATLEGVSRFDGDRFVRFGLADGLPANEVNDILAARDGTIWVATNGGIAVLDTNAATARFALVQAGAANAVYQAPDGAIYGGLDTGLVKFTGRVPTSLSTRPVLAIVSDPHDGSLWLGSYDGLWHGAEHYRVAPTRDDRVLSLHFDREGRLWIGHFDAYITAVKPPLDPSRPLVETAALVYRPTKGARRNVLEDAHGQIWIGTIDELVRYDDEHGFRVVPASALPIGHALGPCVEDGAGNLWFGTNTRGLVRYAPSGFTSFSTEDGLAADDIHGFVETSDALYALPWDNGHLLAKFDGTTFTSVRPVPAPGIIGMAWGWGQTVLRDHAGWWWYPTQDGLERYAPDAVMGVTPPAWVATPAQLPGRDVFRLYEDRRGDVWISTLSKPGLAKWSRGAIEKIAGVGMVAAFAEDATGVWLASGDQLLRVRDDVVEHVLTVKSGDIEALLFDARGQLWLAVNNGGVVRLGVDHQTQTVFDAARGLASDQALALVDDAVGRVYVGTSHGIDRIDLEGSIVHFDIADGLPNDFVYSARRARDGVLWFGTKAGVARLDPKRVHPTVLPPTYIAGAAIDGAAVAMPSRGTPRLELELDANVDALDLAFTIPAFAVGDPIRFQYRLDDAGWGAPVRERSVHYARLAPGRYTFDVRAVAASGIVAQPASVGFTVLAPVWQRWWFLALCALAIATVTYTIVRARVRHVLAIERVRTRIATDLHDELGANLSRISILSEVAIRKADHQPVREQVDEIGKSARALVDVASDIVWSTDPHRDDLASVIARLRSFAGDVLEARDIAWTLTAPDDAAKLTLDPDQRRHVYLIAKEAIHNAAKYSKASRVAIEISAHARSVQVIVRDDGVGFDLGATTSGNGLRNMRARAKEAGAELVIESAPAKGTSVTYRAARSR